VWRERRATWIRDPVRALQEGERLGLSGPHALAVLPVLDGHGETRAIVLAAGAEVHHGFDPWMRSVSTQLTSMLGATLQRRDLERRVDLLLDLVRTVAQGRDEREVYDRAVEAAVKLIPGADAASLLVRRGDAFDYVAASGYDLAALRERTTLRMRDDDELRWYARSRTDFERGIARRIDGDEVRRLTQLVADGVDGREEIERIARLPELLANVCVPIVVGGRTLGMMNVDSLSTRDAFGDAEVALAEAFGHQIAVIFEQIEQRDRLARVATTDPVTGLDNREGFNRRLSRALATVRAGESLHLVMMDLNGFKLVNDRLGHHMGDVALERVARALEEASREGDVVSRWGGDEFAVVIRGAEPDGIHRVAQRYAEVVSQVEVGGIRLGTSVGIATWPDDGTTADDLMKRADAMMYEQKRERSVALRSAT
jgi:diguanylate cyclase (GGDEF)-like protein